MAHTFHRYTVGDEPVAGYRLEEHLGAGGFGEVWKANAPGGTEVALKIIDLTGQQGVQEFASLRVVKKVRHPNLISLQAFWMKDESGQIIDEAGQQAMTADKTASSFDLTMPAPDPKRQTQSAGIAMTAQFARPVELIIAMQLGAKSLYRRLEECREQSLPGVPVAELLEYLEQAARGIDFLNKPIHDMGKGPMPIVHGDIKPHNILVVGDAAVVCDFGLARAVETLRKTSMAPVTVAYAAPESFKGKVTPTSDQYSLAITYVELRTGRLPFDETMTPYQVMEAHVLQSLDFSRLPEPERLVVQRATESEPEARWASSRDMILALRQAVAATGELPLRPGEAAFTGGITPTHAITGRPMARDTDRHTQIKADPHKDTSYPRGHTPSQSLLQDTAHMTPSRRSDPLGETSMLPPSGAPLQPVKKSRGLLIGAISVAAAVALVAVLLPLLNKEEATAKIPAPTTNSVEKNLTEEPEPKAKPAPVEHSNPATPTPPIEPEPVPADPNAQYIKDVQSFINTREFATAAEYLRDKAPSKLPPYEKEALERRLREAFIGFVGSQIERRAFGRALVELEEAPSSVGLSDEDKGQQRDKILGAWLAQADEEFHNEQFATALETAGNLLKRFPGNREALFTIARCQLGLQDNAAALAALGQLGDRESLPPQFRALYSGLSLIAEAPSTADATDPKALLDRLLAYDALEKEAPQETQWRLNSRERDELALVRQKIVDSAAEMLESVPADQAESLLNKLEQLRSPEFGRSEAIELLIAAALGKRSLAANDPAAVFASPFGNSRNADDAFTWLKLARQLSGDAEASPQKLDDDRLRDLKINLMLAAAWKVMPDDALAQTQSVALAKLSDAELGVNAFPVLLTAFRANQGKSGDQTVSMTAAKRLVELFQKQFPIADPQAVELYKQVVQPALVLADGLTAAKKSTEIDAFYAAVADFIGHYKRATWPFADKEGAIEKLLTKAIAINPKVAKYFTARGVARVSQRPPNIEGALSDANEAGELDANLPAAFSLQGHALIYRSRQQPTRKARVADLEQALAKATAAVEKSKPDDKDRAMYLLYTSMAHLEKANFDTDPKLKQQHLEQAVTFAQQAVELEKDKAYPDYAYTALGNALEDMAWIAAVEPEKNYLAAIDAFAAAIGSNPASPDPWIGRARCFYKSLADSKLDPRFLERTKEEAFQAAISDLEQARQLNVELVEPYMWLGKTNQQLGKFAEADAAFGSAVELAEKQKLPERAIYLIDWARNGVLNTTIPAEERGKLVRERAKMLKTAPSLGSTSNSKQAALLIGESLVADKKLAEAIKEYDAALAEYDDAENANKALDPTKADGSDVSLLLARAFTRLNLPGSQWNLRAAEAVIKDAARIAELKPDPKFEALANWYAARSRVQSLNANSPTFTTDFKKKALEPAIADIRRAIQLSPSDPNSWDWRGTGAPLIGARISIAPVPPPDKMKSLAAEARNWINEAIEMVSKRSDLANQMSMLQRRQQDLETSLKAKGL